MRPANPSLDQNYFSGLDQKQKLKHLIEFALLAPSSHNTQPWLFKISGDNEIDVIGNKDRALPHSDPTGRELYVSVGAAVQNLIAAAEYFGYQTEVQISSDVNNYSAAVVRLHSKQKSAAAIDAAPVQSTASDRLDDGQNAEAIFGRHNNRNPFESKMPDQDFLNWAEHSGSQDLTVTLASAEHQKKEIIRIVGEALEKTLDDHDFRQELSHWLKPSLQKYPDGMPGYNLGMPAPISFLLPQLMRRMKMGKTQRKMEEKSLKATPVFAVVSSRLDSKEGWIRSGMLFEKIALAAESRGLKIGVMAAAIEAKDFYKELQKVLGINFRPQIFFRLGYSEKIPKASPRLSINEVLYK